MDCHEILLVQQWFSMLFFIVFLAKYLFFDWSYSTTDFEFIKIFLFVSKKNANTSFLDLKKWGRSFDSGTSPQEVIP